LHPKTDTQGIRAKTVFSTSCSSAFALAASSSSIETSMVGTSAHTTIVASVESDADADDDTK